MALISATPLFAENRWAVSRYGLEGPLPVGFRAAVLSDNGDGVTFLSQDGEAELLVFGAYSLDGGLGESYEMSRARLVRLDADITYDRPGDALFILSGYYADGRIFYHATRLGEGCDGAPIEGSFILRYPTSQRGRFDPWAKTLLDGLQFGACG